MTWAVVLAAGESRRMGRQKLLLPYGEGTVVEAVVRAALGSRIDRVLAVVGADREAVGRVLEPLGVELAVNENFAAGMLSSIQTGFRSLPKEAEAAVVMLGDQPFVTSKVIDLLVEAYRRTGKTIVIPTHGGRRGHPVLIDIEHKGEILGLAPEEGLRRLMRARPEATAEVEVADPGILRDLDKPEEYEESQEGVKPMRRRYE